MVRESRERSEVRAREPKTNPKHNPVSNVQRAETGSKAMSQSQHKRSMQEARIGRQAVGQEREIEHGHGKNAGRLLGKPFNNLAKRVLTWTLNGRKKR